MSTPVVAAPSAAPVGLPGVVGSSSFGATPSLDALDSAISAGGGASAGAPQGAESVAGATPGAQPDGLPAEANPQATEPFTFAGKTWNSREEAEREAGTALGRYRTEQQRAARLDNELAAAREQLRTATALAWQYHQLHTGGQRQGAQPAQQPEPEKPWHATLDWDLAADLFAKNPTDALYYLAQNIEQHFDEKLETRLKAAVEPHEQRAQREQAFNHSVGLFQQHAVLKDGAGQLLYPELHDDAASTDIVRIWTSLPPQLAMGPEGVELAVHRYRLTNGAYTRAAASPAGASGASQRVLQAASAAAGASAETVNGHGSPRPAPPGTPGASSFKQLIGEASPFVTVPGKDGHVLNLGFIGS
jgi:hypothetical protein